jgi:tetratricopeptide (TPR) repeat protein
MKDRTIFAADGLVPFGQIWRTGANQSTTIKFDKDIKFGGKDVEAGTYALYSVPGETTWDIMLYSDLTLGGYVGNYDKSNEVLRVSVDAFEIPGTIESFTIEFDNLRDGSASLILAWESMWISIPIEVHTHDQIMASIDKFAENPMADVAGNYLNSGWYIYTNGGDKAKALEYLDKGCEYTNSPYLFYYMQRKAVVQAAMGDYKGAVATAKAAHENGMNAPANAKGFYDDTVKAELDAHIAEWTAKM